MVSDVLAGSALWSVEQAEALEFLRALPSASVDLVFGSPPYERARLYLEAGENLGIARRTGAWVEWMVELTREALRVCKGLVAWVVEGQTEDFSYTASPLLLAADLRRAGITLRKPPIFARVGIPGSGGPDWLRNDYEFVICATNGGKLPWSDNTACGHPPKWAPGGEMSNRTPKGERVNLIGGKKIDGGRGQKSKTKRNAHGVSETTSRRRTGTGKREKQNAKPFDAADDGTVKGDHDRLTDLVLANPGNVIQPTYTADEVRAMLASCGITDATASELVRCKVGGNLMGNPLCHDNEAPFPEALAAFFVRSFCPEGGIVLDCFSGSGTTDAVAMKWGRRAIACDLRQSQVELSRKRVQGEIGLFHQSES